MLREFGHGLWVADGDVVIGAAGFRFPTRMAAIVLSSGDVLIWSPVALNDALRAAVDDLGPVRHLIAPNTLHHVNLAAWIAAYPDARVYGPPGLAEKRADIAFDHVLSDTPLSEWGDEIGLVLIHNRLANEIVFFHRPSRTVLFTDLLQHLPDDWYAGWRAVVARLDLMTGKQVSVPRKFRLGFADRNATRAAVDRIVAWHPVRLVIAHGPPVEQGGANVIARAFDWLK